MTLPRKKVAILSRHAETAIEQVKSYDSIVRPAIISGERMLVLGNKLYIFVIMGMSSELESKLQSELDDSLLDMIQSKLP